MMALVAFVAGASTWVVAEYVLHRFVGHGRGKSAFALEHRRHHSVGNYFAPTLKKVLNVGPVLLLLALLGGFGVGVAGVTYAAGLSLAYLGYEVLHRRLHTHPPTGWFSRWARRHHFWHHFHDPKKNHGVSTSLFDHLWGTHQPPSRIQVPEKLVMVWLLGPDGEVWPHLREDYELLRLK